MQTIRIQHGGETAMATPETWQGILDAMVTRLGPWGVGSSVEAVSEAPAFAPLPVALPAPVYSDWTTQVTNDAGTK